MKIRKKYLFLGFVSLLGLFGIYCRLTVSRPCVLRVLTPGTPGKFNGYVSAFQSARFEMGGKCSVQTSTYGSTEELLAKLRAKSSSYDLVIASAEDAAPLISGKLVRGIELKKTHAFSGTYLPLRELQVVRVRKDVFGIPLDWTPVELIYDTAVAKTPPVSWNDLWLPQYRGKVAVSDDSFGYLSAAEALGLLKPGSSAPYFLSDDQILKVKAKLLQLKPQLKALTASATESNPRQLAELFGKHEIVLAIGSSWAAELLKRSHPSIASVIPKEGGMARIDFMMFPEQAQNLEKAYQLADLLTQEPEQQQLKRDMGAESPGREVLVQPSTGASKRQPLIPRVAWPTKESAVDREKNVSRFFFVQNPSGRRSVAQLWSDIRGTFLSSK